MEHIVLIATALLTIGPGVAVAQSSWQVESLIPDVISIRVPTTTIAFAPEEIGYPPDEFPARYSATEPENGTLPVQVFVNANGFWSLQLEIPDLRDDSAGLLLPASQVLYRVNGGLWLRADGGPQIIFTGTTATSGWLEIRVDFALELTGNEFAGSYRVEAIVSAIRDPEF